MDAHLMRGLRRRSSASLVGWGERSDAQQQSWINRALGIAALTPTYRLLLCLISTAAISPHVTAGTLNDPTLPPAAVRAEPASTESTAAPAAAEPSRLQMIVRGPGELRTAFIDGKPVRPGDTITVQGESRRVLRISDSALILQRTDQSTETLELAPDAAKAVTRSKNSSSPLLKTTQCSPGKPLSPATACNNAPPVESPR